MRRRGFFAALVGAASTAAAPAIAQAPAPVVAIGQIPSCLECGFQFMVRSAWTKEVFDGQLGRDPADRGWAYVSFMACPNPLCRLLGVEYDLPRVTLARANPVLVACVVEDERRREVRASMYGRQYAVGGEDLERALADLADARYYGVP